MDSPDRPQRPAKPRAVGRRYKEQRTLRTRTQSRTRRQTKLDGCSNLLIKPSDRGAPQDNNTDVQRATSVAKHRPTLSGAKEGRSKEGRKFRPTDSPVLGPTLGRIPYFQLSTPCTYYTHSSRFELPFRGFAILQASAILAAHCCGAVAGGSKQSGNALHEVCRASLPPVRPCRCVVRTRCVTCKLEG